MTVALVGLERLLLLLERQTLVEPQPLLLGRLFLVGLEPEPLAPEQQALVEMEPPRGLSPRRPSAGLEPEHPIVLVGLGQMPFRSEPQV
jgi:hypothetical protein